MSISLMFESQYMAMVECPVYSSLQADSEVKYAAWHTSWLPPGADG